MKTNNNADTIKSTLLKQLLITIFYIVLLGLFYCFFSYPYLVERYYSNKLFPVFAIAGHSLWGWLPVSIGDIGYILLLAFIVRQGYRLSKKLIARQYAMSLVISFKLINGLFLVVTLFYLFWGGNYFRLPLEDRMNLDLQVYESCELLELTAYCIDQANHYRAALPKTAAMENDAIFHRASFLLSTNLSLKAYLFPYHPVLKKPISNLAMNYALVSGYFNPWTQESQINTDIPLFTKPFTACHELAHQAGIGFEDEANLIGFILCTESKSDLFQYSAYYSATIMLLREVYENSPGHYTSLLGMVSADVKADMQTEYAYWRKFSGLFNQVQTLFYNQYLQLNNQPEGIERYNRMTKLLIAWKRRFK